MSLEAAPPKEETTDKPAEKPVEKHTGTPLNQAVKPNTRDDLIPSVYKDMVVVQRKAKKKAEHFLLSPYGTLDFSDGPITAYALNTDIGYAFSDFWEIYANFVPAFVTIERPIIQKVRQLTLANGQQADIQYAKPQFQYGLNLLWLPAYGKESWGPYSIVRSDTFVKVGYQMIKYVGSDSGSRFNAMIGKTYFLSNFWNIRVAAGIAYEQSIVANEKNFSWVPVLETGLVYYF